MDFLLLLCSVPPASLVALQMLPLRLAPDLPPTIQNTNKARRTGEEQPRARGSEYDICHCQELLSVHLTKSMGLYFHMHDNDSSLGEAHATGFKNTLAQTVLMKCVCGYPALRKYQLFTIIMYAN